MVVPRGQLTALRWGVRAVLTLGVAASVAANVLHARQNPISQAIAAWPPVALLLAVELVSRVPIRRRLLTAARVLATGVIALIAAYVSYWHMAGVAARYGEETISAHLLPLSVDGLIVIGSICLVELGAYRTLAIISAAPPVAAATESEPAVAWPKSTDPVSHPGQDAAECGADTTAVAVADRFGAGRYVPSNEEDALMYAAWQRGVAAGREPSGAELARAAGRTGDGSGIGRRAVRRYRDAHAEPGRSDQPEPVWRANGHKPTNSGVTP